MDTDQGMIEKVKGLSVTEALIRVRQKITQRFRGTEASARAAFRQFDKDGGGEVSVRASFVWPWIISLLADNHAPSHWYVRYLSFSRR
eukprot:COSAG02_NODE_521_length_20750_cov_10.721079_12_plen_88_part_00